MATLCERCGSEWPAGSSGCVHCASRETKIADLSGMAMPDDLLTRVRRELASEYEVQQELGRGGMAVVYKAVELELLRPVALKVLPPEIAQTKTMAERFKREARLAASFDHPNIIPIHRVGQAGGIFYIAMKYIEGRSLDGIIEAQGALPIPVVQHVLRAAARALAFAHKNNVVHRDVKGANILIDQDGRVVVTDFGIARATEDANLTGTGLLVGTPFFMSPEQCAGHRVEVQSDQYSLGIVAFEMLAGTVPFRAETIPGIMQHHFFTPVPSLKDVRTDVPPELVEVVQRMLAKRPTDRYASTQDLVDALDAVPFPDDERRRGHEMLRDLVLGVKVHRVDAGVLPPLAETMLMTPPSVARARDAEAELVRREESRRRDRTRIVLAGIAGAAIVATAGFTMARRGNESARPALVQDSTPPGARPVAAPDSTPTGSRVLASRDSAASGSPPAPPAVALVPDESGERRRAESGAAEPRRVPPPPIAATPDPGREPAPTAMGPTGKLRIRVVPSEADIRIDGRLLGRGVVMDSALVAGRRRLRIEAAGYAPIDTVVTVRAGETSQLGTLRLTPAGAP